MEVYNFKSPADVLNVKGNTLKFLKRYDEAVTAFQAALEEQRDDDE